MLVLALWCGVWRSNVCTNKPREAGLGEEFGGGVLLCKLLIEGEERLFAFNFGVGGEATIIKGEFWMREVEGENAGGKSAIVF